MLATALRMMLSHPRGLSVGRPGPRDLTVRTRLARRLAHAKPQVRCVHRSPPLRFVTIGRNALFIANGMAEIIVVICPTRQAASRATEWHDGQFVHEGDARIARRVSDDVNGEVQRPYTSIRLRAQCIDLRGRGYWRESEGIHSLWASAAYAC
ncbi:hypothetical protein BRAS3843_860064 [Bradyrhizobium sp. STM 3843]|nr:hypothetical protein BRAS3843_860064 [Bradyrhizobium sp. STM 3843]